MIIMVWSGINLHTIHSVVYKEVRKIFGELNIYTFVTYCYNLNVGASLESSYIIV